MQEHQYEYPNTLQFALSDLSQAENELDFDQRYVVTSSYNVETCPTGDAIEAFGRFATVINGLVRTRDGGLDVVHLRPLSERTAATVELLRTSPKYALLRDKRAKEQGIAMRSSVLNADIKVTLSGTKLDNED